MPGLKARRRPCASLLLSAVAALLFLLPSLAAPLQYDRGAIAAGEIWRLFTGHWVHSSFDHLFWDVIVFGFLGMGSELRSRFRFLICVLTSPLAISLAIWVCAPGIVAYRGLSGVDSALFGLLFVELLTAAASMRRPSHMAIAVACFAAFLFKISFELITGNTLFVASTGSAWVAVPLAHIAGATVGFLVGLAGTVRPIRRLRTVVGMPAFRRTVGALF